MIPFLIHLHEMNHGMAFSIEHMLNIDAEPSEVYHAVATEEGYKKWWTTECYGDFTTGGEVHFDFGERYKNTFKIECLDPGHHVVMQCIVSVPEWKDTIIDIRISPSEQGAMVRFTHSGYAENNDFYAHCNYSWRYYLKSLKDLLEKGQGSPSSH